MFELWSSSVMVEVNLVQLFLKFKPLLKQKSVSVGKIFRSVFQYS